MRSPSIVIVANPQEADQCRSALQNTDLVVHVAEAGDGAAVSQEESLTFSAVESDETAEVLLFDLA